MTTTEQRQQADVLVLEPTSPTAPQVTAVAIEAATVDGFDLADPDASGDYETLDVGPFAGQYLRLVSTDLVAVADALRRLADRIIDLTVDGREEQAALECPYCPTQIDEGDPFCGSHDCRRQWELDLIGSDR